MEKDSRWLFCWDRSCSAVDVSGRCRPFSAAFLPVVARDFEPCEGGTQDENMEKPYGQDVLVRLTTLHMYDILPGEELGAKEVYTQIHRRIYPLSRTLSDDFVGYTQSYPTNPLDNPLDEVYILQICRIIGSIATDLQVNRIVGLLTLVVLLVCEKVETRAKH